MRSIVTGALALLLVACAGAPEAPPTFDEPPDVTPDGLVRVDSPVFELVYAKPGVDLSGYDLIRIRPIGLGYKEEPSKGRLLVQPSGNFELTQAQRSRVSQAFAKAFSDAMTSDGRYKLVTSRIDRAMQIQLALARLEVNIPEPRRGSDEVVMVDKVGELTLVVEISDALSGEPLVRGRDTYVIAGGTETREQITMEITDLFTRWSQDIRRGVDSVSTGR
ncbi:MAG: DUF3313 family protein [Pseudomonadota bacterium]